MRPLKNVHLHALITPIVAFCLTFLLVLVMQVAADANTSGQVYPDQSLYPCDSVPTLVRRINKALQRADQVILYISPLKLSYFYYCRHGLRLIWSTMFLD